MTMTTVLIQTVLDELHPGDEVISAARARRDEVLDAAGQFEGWLRTYWSGSIAHRTANSDTDADGGVVLDRRSYPELGPDGNNEGPQQIVEDVREYLRNQLKKEHLNMKFRLTKRAIQITYHEPVDNDGVYDPSADLIVGLTRREGKGLWIPNLEQDRWDASHPELHTELLTAEPKALRQKRAKVIRLAKGWNKQFDRPAVCSFNIEALALSSVEAGIGLAEALLNFFEDSALDLDKRLTPDPAGVSPPIKTLIDRKDAAKRFESAGTQLSNAIKSGEDECAVRAALSKLFKNFIEPCDADTEMRERLLNGGSGFTTAGFVATSTSGQRQRTTRSYGGLRRSAEI